MSVVDSFYSEVERGLQGLNVGIPTGMAELDKYTYGVQRKYMYLIGGDTGSGKTTYALFTYVYKPLQYTLEHPEIPVDILYFSLEMSKETLCANLLSLYILDKYHVYISYKEIFSLDTPLSAEKLKYVKESREWLEKVMCHLTIYDKAANANVVNTATRMWASNFGDFEETETSEIFTPFDENQYLITAVDHLRLLAGNDKKTEINTCSDALVALRDLCKLTVVLIQQLNRNFKSMERRTSAYAYISLEDFADASGPSQNAEIVIALYYPHREKRNTCEGYDIKKLRDSFRLIQILKQRYGTADILKGVLFKGEIGYYKELPNPEVYELDYEQFNSPSYIWEDSSVNQSKKDINDDKGLTFNFNLK